MTAVSLAGWSERTTGDSVAAELREALKETIDADWTPENVRRVGLAIMRKVVPTWQPGQRLDQVEAVKVGELLETVIAACRNGSWRGLPTRIANELRAIQQESPVGGLR